MVTSNITITRIEVWITNIGAPVTNNRNIVAFEDLGEERADKLNNPGKVYIKPSKGTKGYVYYNTPSNFANTIYSEFNKTVRNISTVDNVLTSKGFVGSKDYEKIESARLLNSNEYTFNSRLGFISLNTQLNPGQVLAVAYQYKVNSPALSDSTFQVGDFSTSLNAPNNLIVKLLQGTAVYPHSPIWNLMMKNVYSLGGYQINKDKFVLNILYTDDKTGVPTNFST